MSGPHATRCFGTDGIRDRAGSGFLSPEAVRAWGGAAGVYLQHRGVRSPRVVSVRDTRASGSDIETQFAAGLASGAEFLRAGVLPGPAASVLVREGFDLGVVVSASHNPASDNGIKFFLPDGAKMPERDEILLEGFWHARRSPGGAPARDLPWPEAATRYRERLRAASPRGAPALLRVVLDCAHGACWEVGPAFLRERGVEVTTIGDAPDGRNINAGCGAAAPEALSRAVRERGADLGLALDGDGDRLVCADRFGAIRDGDDLLVIAASCLGSAGRLGPRAVAGTIMTNVGVEWALARGGVALRRAPVGDRNVSDAMRAERLSVGGESSGHMIFRSWGPTGDGLVTAAHLLSFLATSGRDLAAWGGAWRRVPSVQKSVRCGAKPDLAILERFAPALDRERNALGARGRIVARYSGTEPLLRILVEGEDAAEVARIAGSLAASAAEDLR
ncbi:MAG: phosphoglucosamine mutase [Planctomycetes bacterium]|nr:phosphoglucosamine mutase [Planctomycetota bacterium]